MNLRTRHWRVLDMQCKKIPMHLLILYGLTEPSDLMWLRLNIAITFQLALLTALPLFLDISSRSSQSSQ